MQIKVKCSCGEGNCPEWAIVEIQGVVEPQPSFQDRLQNLQIGILCRPSSQESYTFTVGYHELIGAKVSLKKPILVLKKIKLQNEEEEEGGGDLNSKGVELDVIGVIRHKILFKTRPKALISNYVEMRFRGFALSSCFVIGVISWNECNGVGNAFATYEMHSTSTCMLPRVNLGMACVAI